MRGSAIIGVHAVAAKANHFAMVRTKAQDFHP